MPRWLKILAAGVSSILLGLAVSSVTADLTVLLLFVGTVAVVAAILYRPRELRAADVARMIEASGTDWGTGIGPVPGEAGQVIPGEQLPFVVTRQYRARSRELLERLRIIDASLLASRGYVPASQQYVDGRRRGVDWIAVLFLLLCFFVVGIVALLYMVSNKPVGTLTVTYERRESALDQGLALSAA